MQYMAWRFRGDVRGSATASQATPTSGALLTHARLSVQRLERARLLIVGLVLLLYLAVDGAMLSQHMTQPLWDISVAPNGIVTWVDPNGPTSPTQIQVGDRLLQA